MTNSIIRNRRIPSIITSNFFDELVDELFDHQKAFNVPATYPYDISITKDENGNTISYKITYALAGIEKNNIDIKVVKDQLAICVKKKEETKEDNVTYLHKGISHRTMDAKFNVGKDVDVDNITSKFENGLLEIFVPIKAEVNKELNINIT